MFSVEIISELAAEAERRLRVAGYVKVELRVGDGSRGWPEHAPYDKIIVTAAPEQIPSALLDQLKPGGRMVTEDITIARIAGMPAVAKP